MVLILEKIRAFAELDEKLFQKENNLRRDVYEDEADFYYVSGVVPQQHWCPLMILASLCAISMNLMYVMVISIIFSLTSEVVPFVSYS